MPTTPVQRVSAGFERAKGRWTSWLLSTVLAVASGGCSPPNEPLRGRLHVLVASANDEGLNSSDQDILKNVRFLTEEFNKLHPRVALTFSVARERELESLLARRQLMGLAPDLVLTSTTSAVRLDASKLTQPVSLKPSLISQLDHSALQRLRRDDETLAGVPMTRYPDLACFNTDAIGSTPPQTLDELLALEKRGLESGFAVEDRHLLWTAGAFGADLALADLLGGAQANRERRAVIKRWLAWLREANQVTGIYFLNRMNQLVEHLQLGKLDWIMCNSLTIPRLREALGGKLGVAVLPRGSTGEPTRIIRQQVWALMRDQSPKQKALSMALVQFSVNSPFQALFSLTSSNSLPVNTVVAPQTTHQDATVRAMVEASRQSRGSLSLSEATAHNPKILKPLNQVLRQVIDSEIPLDEGLDALLHILQHP